MIGQVTSGQHTVSPIRPYRCPLVEGATQKFFADVTLVRVGDMVSETDTDQALVFTARIVAGEAERAKVGITSFLLTGPKGGIRPLP
jgi:hypothetical protein